MSYHRDDGRRAGFAFAMFCRYAPDTLRVLWRLCKGFAERQYPKKEVRDGG